MAAETSLISPCIQVTGRVRPVALRVPPRDAGKARVTVLPESRRVMTGRPFTRTGSMGVLGRDAEGASIQPGLLDWLSVHRVRLSGHGYVPVHFIGGTAVRVVPLPIKLKVGSAGRLDATGPWVEFPPLTPANVQGGQSTVEAFYLLSEGAGASHLHGFVLFGWQNP